MQFFCEIKLSPLWSTDPGLRKAAIPADYLASHRKFSHHTNKNGEPALCVSIRSRAYEIPQPFTRSPFASKITTEMCSSGLALPGGLPVEHTFKKCWSELFYFCHKEEQFQNMMTKAEWQPYQQHIRPCEQFSTSSVHNVSSQPLFFWCMFAFTLPFL